MPREERYTVSVTLSSDEVREYSHWFEAGMTDMAIASRLERSYPEAVSIEFETVSYTRPVVRRRNPTGGGRDDDPTRPR